MTFFSNDHWYILVKTDDKLITNLCKVNY